MRALIFLAVFCLACVTAFPQALLTVTPPPSAVCSIPLLRFTPPDIDPLISKKLPPASDRTSQARVPAPPCDEPAAQPSTLARSLRDHAAKIFQSAPPAQRLGEQKETADAVQKSVLSQRLREQKERISALLERFSSGTQPSPAEETDALPTPAP